MIEYSIQRLYAYKISFWNVVTGAQLFPRDSGSKVFWLVLHLYIDMYDDEALRGSEHMAM